MSTEEAKPITVKKLPLILNRNILLKKGINKPCNRNIKIVKSLPKSIQEDVIYTSELGDFTSGEARNMTIVNRLNVLTKSSQTVAKCQSHTGEVFEKTSDEITKLIGQNNYDILFSSLCSIISQELKIRSINSLLTIPKLSKSVSCQTETSDKSFSAKKNVVDTSCQTHETCLKDIKKFKPKKRNKRQHLTPYAVRDVPEEKPPKKVIITPDKFEMLFMKEKIIKDESLVSETSLPELGSVFNDDSNSSLGRYSSLSVNTIPDLMSNPLNILVDKHTKDTSNEVNQPEIQATYHNLDSPQDISPKNNKLPFGMKEMLRNIPPEQRIKLLIRQGFNDLKYCLTPDNEGHLPIHVAVLTNDVDLLRRQCLVLKMRDTSVDVPADGLTPLRMSFFQENTEITSILLRFGADPLDTDDEDRTAFHIAAEMGTDHLQILVHYCQHNARLILQQNEELWKPGFEHKSDEELAPLLFMYINKSCDTQGYTPLMLASKLGKYNNVMTLVESCRQTINLRMPSSGNTALYLAVGAACMDSVERGNKAKVVDHFRRTIECLVENGADPNIENFAGSSVNDLLTEFYIAELSMLIANKLTSVRYFDGQLPDGIKSADFMLFKDDKGQINLKDIKDGTERNKVNVKEVKEKDKKVNVVVPKTPPLKKEVKEKDKKVNVVVTKTPPLKTATITKSSPVILENVSYKPPDKTNSASTIKPNVTTSQTLANASKVGNTAKIKQEKVNASQNYTSVVKNFKLNKPLLIKSGVTNNKRKLEIVIEPSIKYKKANKKD